MLGVFFYGLLYGFIHSMRLIGWWRIRSVGTANLPPREQGGIVIAMNHIHWLDIPMVGALLPFRYRLSWLAKSEIFQNPLFAWWLRVMNVIPIKRGKRDLAALDAAVGGLRDGAVLLIFPEGHRSRNGVLQPGRGGAIRMAMQSGAPIVPVAITGTEGGLLGMFKRKPIVMQVGQPFTIPATENGKIAPDEMDRLTREMMLRIAEMLPPAQRGPYAELTTTNDGE